jgi:hypothetical protein
VSVGGRVARCLAKAIDLLALEDLELKCLTVSRFPVRCCGVAAGP